jgi:L-fuculose-phosphate aldolase
MDISRAKEEVIEAGRLLVERGLVARTWGNVSCRIDENRFAITPSGIAYERLTPDTIVVVDIHTLAHQGDVKPSSEKGIHANAYRLNPKVNFVIHTHQTYATVLSVAGFSALNPTTEEKELLGGDVKRAKYGLPGSKKLRNNTAKALADGSAAILMERHGALLTGPDRDTAFRRAVVLEDICRRAAQPPGTAVNPLTSEKGSRALSRSGTDLRPVEQLHAAIYKQYPDFNHIAQLSSPAVETVTQSTKKLPALIDDFAQMAGSDAKVRGPLSARHLQRDIRQAVAALRGGNCVFVRGIGAVCCAAKESDCTALLSLVEKNALAYVNALAYDPHGSSDPSGSSGSHGPSGTPKPLSYIDRKLMRFVYQLVYSKKEAIK